MDMEQYYIKKGRKYIPVCRFDGFPADGVWIVKDMSRSSRLVLEIDNDPISITDLRDRVILSDTLYEDIIDVLTENRYLSISDLASIISNEITNKLK